MIETICTPYGKAAFPTVVKCDGCGKVIYDGLCDPKCEHHWCDEECNPESKTWEFRTCNYCGKPMTEGFMVEGGGWYCCDDCFEPMMNRDYPNGYRANTHDDDPCWCDGMWDYKDDDGKWYDTGIFYTEWY